MIMLLFFFYLFVSTVKLTRFNSDVAFNKRTAYNGSFFFLWLFSCIDCMALAVSHGFLGLMVMERLQSNVQRIL